MESYSTLDVILDTIRDLFSDSPGIAIFDPLIFSEALREYPVFYAFVAFWFGCCIGSFLNVCVYRLPLGMSLVSPPSHCTVCEHKISVWENIPIFSYLLRSFIQEKSGISGEYRLKKKPETE